MTPSQDVYFLGGRDLEMETIAALLAAAPGPPIVHDARLAWGAAASAYRAELAAELAAGRTPVLVELNLDLPPAELPADRVAVVDHHGPKAGKNAKTSLEKVFERLGLPPKAWTRRHALVAANDRGHIPALVALGADADEIAATRAADRRAQGITPAEEDEGRRAAAAAELRLDGRLTVARPSHHRTAAVADPLAPELGGPGYRNLAVLAPTQTSYFGAGAGVDALRRHEPVGWYGGDLPDRGFWGCNRAIPIDELLTLLKGVLE
ncbi:MAG: hypothetical protein ACRC1K_10895 [Planctomycetia bacterium]